MTQKHTALPWASIHYNDNKAIICHQPDDMSQPEICVAEIECKAKEIPVFEANAALIVRAVNSHYELLAALKKAVEYLPDCDEALAAIAKAEAAE